MALSYKTAFSYQQNTSTTNIATAYGQVIAASSIGAYQSGKLQYYNSTGQTLVMGVSPTSGSVQNILSIPPTSTPVVIEMLTPSGNNIFLKSVTVAATSGEVTLDFFI